MRGIFISYRRDDNSGYAGRLADSLRIRFGEGQVFRDCEDIAMGAVFEQDIFDALRSASVMLLLIGPRWLTLTDDGGRPCIEGAEDYVRLEIAVALESDVRIIPILLPGATMPTREQLPPSLVELARRQAVALRDDRWKADVRELIRQIELAGVPEGTTSQVVTPDGNSANPAIGAARRFLPDLFLALGHPARFLKNRNSGRMPELLSAIVFFCLTHLLTQALIVVAIKEPKGGSFIIGYLALIFVSGVLLVVLSGPLWLAWWLVGARGHFRKIFINLVFQFAPFWFLVFLAGAIQITGFGIYDPDVFIDVYTTLMEAPPGEGAARAAAKLRSVPKGIVTYVASGLMILINIWTLVWLFRSWSGYRLVLEKSRLQSLLALCLFVFLTAGLPLFSHWLASPQPAAG